MAAFAILIGFVMTMAVASIAVARKLPDGPVPTHFNLSGRADKFGSRWVALGAVPIFYFLLSCVLLVLPMLSGTGTDQQEREGIAGAVVAGTLVLLAHLLVLWLMLRWIRSA